MIDNEPISPTQQSSSTFDVNTELNRVNKKYGLNLPTTPIYDPRPAAIDIYNNVVGNHLSGSNPGARPDPTGTFAEQMQHSSSFTDNLVNYANASGKTDLTSVMRPFTYNGDSDGANFERYYNSKPFKELGFNPYRDNEHLYNNNMTTGDEFVRAAAQWPSLISTGFRSGFRSWSTLFTDPLAADLQGGKEMQRIMALGSSSKDGVGSFFINTFLNSGYTLGIGGNMLVESLALAGATAAAGGLDIGITAPAWMARMGMGATKIARGVELVNEAKALKSTSAIKNFWDTNRVGQVLAKTGAILNPLENTWDMAKGVVRGTGALSDLSNFAKYSKTFGAFAKDIISIKAGVSEAQLEGGMVQLDITKDLIQNYREKNNGEEPTGDALTRIESIAKDEARRTALWNLPAIMVSNKFMYELLFAPFEKTAKKGIMNLADDILFKAGKVEGAGVFTGVKSGVLGNLQKLRAGITQPKEWGKFGYNYLKANTAEGIQENLQEAISSGAKAHALATYNNPDRNAYEGYMGHFMTGMGHQISAQGAETFAGGFVMGAMAKPFMGTAMWAGEGLWNNTVNRGDHQSYQQQRDEQLAKTVTTLNEFYKNPHAYLAPDMINAIKQNTLQKDFFQANIDNMRKKAVDAKSTSIFEHMYTALNTGKFDIILDKFNKMKELSPDAIKDAFNVQDGTKALNLLNDVTIRAESIKKTYEEVASSFPNPYDPFRQKKGTPEFEAQSNAYNAWEDAKKNLIFSKSEFENHSLRIKQLTDTLISKRNPVKNANAQDLMTLMDKGQMEVTLLDLKRVVKTTDSSTPEGRKVINYNQKKLELLEKLSAGFELLPELTTKADARANDKKTRTAFKNYINHIAQTTGDIAFDDELLHALELIKDNYTLRDERGSLIRSINVLSNPKGFLNLHRGLIEVHAQIQKDKELDVAKRSKLFSDFIQTNKAGNSLFKEAAVYLTPEYYAIVADALKNNQIIPMPTVFINAKDPNLAEITDPKDPIFKKAMEIWIKIAKAIQAVNAKPPVIIPLTKEELIAERDAKLNSIKIDATKMIKGNIFYTLDMEYIVMEPGIASLTDESGGFGNDDQFTISTLGDTYSQNPKLIIDEYNKKISELALIEVDIEAQKAAIERRRQEELNGVYKKWSDFKVGDIISADIEEESISIPGEDIKTKIKSFDNFKIRSIVPKADKSTAIIRLTDGNELLEYYEKELIDGIKRRINTKYNAELTALEDKPVITPGLLIYATTGAGKTAWVRAHPEKYVDADDLLVKAIRDSGIKVPEDESPQKTMLKFANMVGAKSKEKEELYAKVLIQLQKEMKKGKTVLTGSVLFIKDSDLVYIQTEDDVLIKAGLSEFDIQYLRTNEKRELAIGRKTRKSLKGIPLTGNISQILSIKPKKKEKITPKPGIKTAAHPSTALIKKGMKFGFTKENIIAMSIEERNIIQTNLEITSDEIQELLYKYKSKLKAEYILQEIHIKNVSREVSNIGKPGEIKGFNIIFKNLGVPGAYHVYKADNGEFRVIIYKRANDPIAYSTKSIEDAVQKAFNILKPEADKEIDALEDIDITNELNMIKNFKGTLEKFNTTLYDSQAMMNLMALLSPASNMILSKALSEKYHELKNKIKTEVFTYDSLKIALKNGWGVVIGGKDYLTFTLSKKQQTIRVMMSDYGTKYQSFPFSDIEKLIDPDDMTPTGTPITTPVITPEIEAIITDVSKTGDDITSTSSFKDAIKNASTHTDDDFLDDVKKPCNQ